MGHPRTKTKATPAHWPRWLALAAVVLAVVAILVLKRTGSASGGLAVADVAAPAAVPTLHPAAAAGADDPFPAQPEAQVDWVLRNSRAALISFHSNNCKPCIAMTDLVGRVWPDYAGRLILIDVLTTEASNASLVQRAGIRSIPTTFFVDSGGQGRGYVGLIAEESLRAELDRLAGGQ